MKKLLISLIAGLSLLGGVAYAQVSSNYWKLQGTVLSPLSSSWTVNTGGGGATSTFGFITATTTNATSTFAGNVKIDGDLQVLGNFYAPVSIVSGGNIQLRFQDVLQSLDSVATVRNLITIGGTDHVEVGDTSLETDVYAVGLLSFLSPVSYVNGKLGVATTTPDKDFVVEGQSLFTATTSIMGNLGIGTESPAYRLDVDGNVRNAGYFIGVDTLGAGNIQYLFANDVGNSFINSGKFGLATTTPISRLSLGSGSINVYETTLATSTSMTIDFTNGNTQLIRMGTSATTIGFSNNTPGAVVKLVICNPAGGSAGAITWSGVTWSGGAAPAQTTSANKCDVWSFLSTNATSTLRIFGSAATNF